VHLSLNVAITNSIRLWCRIGHLVLIIVVFQQNKSVMSDFVAFFSCLALGSGVLRSSKTGPEF